MGFIAFVVSGQFGSFGKMFQRKKEKEGKGIKQKWMRVCNIVSGHLDHLVKKKRNKNYYFPTDKQLRAPAGYLFLFRLNFLRAKRPAISRQRFDDANHQYLIYNINKSIYLPVKQKQSTRP
jgi:hypothetical protein